MTKASYTLKSNGLATKNITEIVNSEWWSRSPQEITGVGDGFEAMAVVVDNTGATLTGIFNEWIRLDVDRTWSAEFIGDATTNINISVRDSGTQQILGRSNISLVNEQQGPSTFVESVTSLDPVNWFRLNESTGLVATDSGSIGFDADYPKDAGTIGYDIAPSSTHTGAGTRAKQFNSTADVIVQPLTSTNVSPIPQMTLEFAWNPNIINPASVRVLEEAEVPNPSSAPHWFFQQEITGLKFRFYWDDGINSKNRNLLVANTTQFLVTQWNYISLVFDFSGTGTLDVRINNIPVFSTDISPDGAIDARFGNGNQVISVGGNPTLFNFADAGLDEVQKYLKILTSDERDTNYNFWKTGTPNPPTCLGFSSVLLASLNPTVTGFGVGVLPPTITVCAGDFIAYQFDQATIDTNSAFFLMQLAVGTSVDINIYEDGGIGNGAQFLVTAYGTQTAPFNFSWDATGFGGLVCWLVFQNTTGSDQSIRIIDDQP